MQKKFEIDINDTGKWPDLCLCSCLRSSQTLIRLLVPMSREIFKKNVCFDHEVIKNKVSTMS